MSPRAFETVATLELLLVCGRVPALVPVDLFRCVWRLERKKESDVHLGVRVEQVPLF